MNIKDLRTSAVLHQLMLAGTVRIEDGAYVGTAADGVVVQLGTVGMESSLFKYLAARPTPDKW